MPYKRYGNCVYKMNPDGSKGKLKGCSKSPEEAAKYARALYANTQEKEMATSKQREKRRERRLKMANIAKAKAAEIEEIEELPVEDELLDEDEVLELEDETEEKELTQKDYGGDMGMSMPMMGPTSFAELDAMNAAREKAHEVGELSYNVQDLVWNICHAQMSPEEQAKAITNVGNDFGKRVKEVMSAPVEKERDMDLLQLEALIAKDNRSTSVIEKIGTFFTKSELTYAAEKKLPDSAFALPSKRKYPIHDKAHVRNALARAAQQIKEGGAGAADAKAALPAIRAAAKKFGVGMEKERGIIVEKDASGSWRWVGYPTNNFKDHSGDIITEEAHTEYVDWVNKDLTERAPVFTSCHAPGTVRENPVDFVGYENGFVVMSGKLTEKEAESLLKASALCDVGMSHTSWGWRDTDEPAHIVKYRAFEVTDLPVETADNPFTFLDLEISKEVDMDQLEYLTGLLGSKERAEAALKAKTSMKQKELQAAGVESKEKEVEKTPEPPAKVEVKSDEIVAKVLKEMDADGLNAWVAKAQEAIEKVEVLETVVKQLSVSKENDLAEMINPPASKRFNWSRATENTSNLVSKDKPTEQDKKLVEKATGLNDEWAEAFKVTPLQN